MTKRRRCLRLLGRRPHRGRVLAVRIWSGALAVAFIISGCGGEIATSARAEPPSADELSMGQDLYEQNCAECHGVDLRGTDKGPSHLSKVYEPSHHGDGAFLVAVLRGVGAHHWSFGDMPPIPGLSNDDVAAITSYVRSVQDREGFEPYPP